MDPFTNAYHQQKFDESVSAFENVLHIAGNPTLLSMHIPLPLIPRFEELQTTQQYER